MKNIVKIILITIFPLILIAEITKGPYLLSPTESGISIMWESDNASECSVEYWQDISNKESIQLQFFDKKSDLYLFRITLNDLKSGEKYFYRISQNETQSTVVNFKTNPGDKTDFQLLVMGDSRTGHDTFSTIVEQVNKISPDLIISMGDLVERGRVFEEYGPHYFQPAQSLINHIPLMSTLGDHETADNYDGESFYYHFRNGIDKDRQWFSFDYGPIHFVSLDHRGESSQEMIDWFKQDMEATTAKWKIVYLHRPSYNLGGHRSHWGAPVWTELYSQYKVDIVFAGHSHLYERFYPMQVSGNTDSWPVTYITTGGAGAGLYETVEHPNLVVSESVNHYLIMDVSQNTLAIEAKRIDGTLLDKFEITKEEATYTDDYLSQVKSSEILDIYLTFASQLRLKYRKEFPGKKVAAEKIIEFNGKGLPGDIPFSLVLAEESKKYFRIEPFEGVLKKDTIFRKNLKLYRKRKLATKGKYFNPPLRFNVKYEYKGKTFIVEGRESRYQLQYDMVKQMYIDENKSARQIAKELSCPIKTIEYWIRKFELMKSD